MNTWEKMCPILKGKCTWNECVFYVQVDHEKIISKGINPKTGNESYAYETFTYKPIYGCAIKGRKYIIT